MADSKRPYEPPRLDDIGTADERAYGLTVRCGGGGGDSSGGCGGGNDNSGGGCGGGSGNSAGSCGGGNNNTAGGCGGGNKVTAGVRRRRA